MDAEVELMEPIEKLDIIIQKAHDPLDLNWLNMGGHASVNTISRLFLNVIVISILVFLTTPTVLYH